MIPMKTDIFSPITRNWQRYDMGGASKLSFEEGVDSIKADEFTLVQSDSGYYVIKRLPLDESQECFEEEYENEAETINTTMQNNAFYEQVQKWADEYGIKVTVNDEVLDKIN